MNKKRLLFGIFTLITAVLISSPFASGQSLLDQKNELERQLQQVRNQKATTERERKEKEAQIRDLESRSSQLDSQINNLRGEIGEVVEQVDQKESSIVDASTSIEELNQKILASKEEIKSLLIDLYSQSLMKNGVLIAASSGSLSEALDEATYADSIQGQINEILDDIVAHKIFLENEKERYNREKSELAARQKQLEEEKNALESSKIRAESLAEQNRTEINSLLGNIDSLTDKEKELREEVMAINARLVASRRSSTISVADSPLGKIIWPSNVTYCSQGYGMTQFARQGWYGGQGHNGFDIAGSGSVLAVADGVVLARNSGNCPNGGFRSCAGGWGNWVAIRHSSGHVTLYTHLSGGASVSTGQSVSQGQVIGRIGNSGNSTGPHLHFSIYQSFGLTSSGNPDYAYGSTLNPENYYNVRCMDP